MEFLVTLSVNKHVTWKWVSKVKNHIFYGLYSTSHIYCNITAHPVDFFPLSYIHTTQLGGKSEFFLSQKMLDKGLKVKMEKNSIGLEFSQNLNRKTIWVNKNKVNSEFINKNTN